MLFIKSRNVTHNYDIFDEAGNKSGSKTVLHGMSLDIHQGQFIGILGHNGSGKSTFAKHLNALLAADEGELVIDGYDTKEVENIFAIRQTCGMVFQNPDNQIVGVTVEEDVAFGPENLGIPTPEINQRVEDALKHMKLSEYRLKSPNHLSGGQKQRVAIAGALAMRTKCIVLDEPTAMLDPQGRKQVMDAIHELNKHHRITIILITHQLEEVVDADRIFVMNHGMVAMEGTPREVFVRIEELESMKLDVPFAVKVASRLREKGIIEREDILYEDELIEEIVKKKKI